MKVTVGVRRVALAIAVMIFVVSAAFANGSKEGGSSSGTGGGAITAAMTSGPNGYPSYSGPKTEITMWAWTSNENYSIDLFQKLYPNITVKWSNIGGGGTEYDKVLTATSANAGLPDVIMSEYTYAPQFMTYGSFQAINKWVPQALYLKYYPEVTLKWTSLDGKLYGTPQDSGAMTMVYRKDVFDKYGLTVPTTWDQFAQQAAKLHSQTSNVTMLSFPMNWILGPMGFVWQAGGKWFDYYNGNWYIDFTNPTSKKVFAYWAKLISDGSVKADMWWNSDWYKELSVGGSATVVSGGWFPEWLQLNSKDSAGNWRVALVPQWDASNPQNGEMGGSGFYVSSQSKNAEAAADFVLWLNSANESLVQLHDKSQLPVLWGNNFLTGVAPSLLNQTYDYFGGQAITQVSVDALKQVKTAFTALPVMNYLESSYEQQIKDVVDGKQTTDQMLQSWQDEVVAFMKKQGFNNVIVGQLPPQ